MEFKDRKEADKFGNNVYAVLDTWKPTGTNKVAVQDANMETASNDNLPF